MRSAFAGRGLAGIGMDSDGCSARCSMDGAVRYRIVVVPCIQGACRIPAVDGIGVHAGYRSDCYAPVSFGHFSSVQSSLRQLGSGIVTIGVGMVLAMVGFDSSLPQQSWKASIGVAVVMLGFCTVSMIVCWIVSSRLIINQQTDLDVLHEVERLRAGGDKADVDSSVRRTVEQLTGLPYEECWK